LTCPPIHAQCRGRLALTLRRLRALRPELWALLGELDPRVLREGLALGLVADPPEPLAVKAVCYLEPPR